MKHIHRRLVLLLCLAVLGLLLFALPVSADVGNVDWGGGGGDDWGGGGDWGGGYGGDVYFSSDGGDMDFSPVTVVVIVVVLIVVFVLRQKLGIGGSARVRPSMPMNPNSTPTQSATTNQAAMSEQATLERLRATDPDFAAEQFKTFAGDVFLRVQEAWEAKDWAVIRPYESDKLFNLHQRQLQEFIDAKKTNYMNEQYIRQVSLAGFREDGVNEVLTVRLEATLLDYTVDDTTGAVVSGSKTARQTRVYRLEFIRTRGTKTDNGTGIKAHQCPSCGAPLELNASGVCAYCGNVVTSGEYGWVLNEYNRW